MNAESKIRELIQAFLSDDHKSDAVRFMDNLLRVATECDQVRCSFAGDGKLRFQVQDQPAWEVELGRAKSKLRLLCARLGVLCNEGGDVGVSLYGGKGVIDISQAVSGQDGPPAPGPDYDGQSSPRASFRASEGLSAKAARKVAVHFKNTMAEQEFTIQAQ